MAKKKKTDSAIEPKASEVSTFLKKDLESVANELSTVMKFTEPIPTGKKETITTLTKDIKEAALELEKEDAISDETLAILAGLKATLPWDITVDAKEEQEAEVKEEPKAEMPPNLVDGKEEKTPKKKAESAKPKEAGKEKKEKYTRAQAFCDALQGGPKTIEEIAKKAISLYEGETKKEGTQIKTAIWNVTLSLQPLLILGFVEKSNKKYSLR